MGGSAVVAVGMLVMNLAVYVFSLITAHALIPAEFGAFTALLGILQIGSVASLGLQAAGARRIAVESVNRAATVSTVVRSTTLVSLLVGAAVAISTPVTTAILRLDSVWLVPLCGAALVPLTAMGGLSAIAQGTERWGVLTAINIANGVGRLAAGGIALWVSPTVLGATIGLAIGALAPVAVAIVALDLQRGARTVSRRGLLSESLLSTVTLFAFFAFSNIDALVARNQLPDYQAGLYAAGLIISKAALLGPGFVSVVLFPRFARDTSGAYRLRGVAVVAAIGAIGVWLVAALPTVAMQLAGGSQYAEVTDRLWLFALAGSLLGVAQLLVFDALARHTHWISWLLWCAAVAVPFTAVVADVGVTGLVLTVAGVAGVLIAALLPHRTTRD
jgi:O-antigen/teichoic acid export membrane protein